MFDGNTAYVLLLGVVAAFNPCGFALLPAYITLIVTRSAQGTVSRREAVRRAITFGLAMTFGAVAVFSAFGLLFGAVNLRLQGSILPYTSYVTLVIGVGVVVLGTVMAVTGELRGPALRVQLWAPRSTIWSQIGYGATFAIASLSCTIGLFLAVVSQSLLASNPVEAVMPFVVYAVGMGATIVIVSVLSALAGSGVAAAIRNRTMLIMRAGGVLMILAGLYVVVFALAEILPRFGIESLNSVLLTTARWQSRVTVAIDAWGTPTLVVIVVVAGAAVLWAYLRAGTQPEAEHDGKQGLGPEETERVAGTPPAD